MKRTALGFLAICSIPVFFGDVYADSTIGVLPLTEGYTQEAPKIDAGGAIQIKPGEIPMPSAINSDPSLVPPPSPDTGKNMNVIGPVQKGDLPLYMRQETVIPPGSMPPELQKIRDSHLAIRYQQKGDGHKSKHKPAGNSTGKP
jgi:hypothetical protein